MKKVKFSKKLSLNKNLISNLNTSEFNGVKGGGTTDGFKTYYVDCISIYIECHATQINCLPSVGICG